MCVKVISFFLLPISLTGTQKHKQKTKKVEERGLQSLLAAHWQRQEGQKAKIYLDVSDSDHLGVSGVLVKSYWELSEQKAVLRDRKITMSAETQMYLVTMG